VRARAEVEEPRELVRSLVLLRKFRTSQVRAPAPGSAHSSRSERWRKLPLYPTGCSRWRRLSGAYLSPQIQSRKFRRSVCRNCQLARGHRACKPEGITRARANCLASSIAPLGRFCPLSAAEHCAAAGKARVCEGAAGLLRRWAAAGSAVYFAAYESASAARKDTDAQDVAPQTEPKSRSGRAARERRPISQRWRGLQRGPFVLHSWPFSSCLGLYALRERFQSSEDSICRAGRISIPRSGKALRQWKPTQDFPSACWRNQRVTPCLSQCSRSLSRLGR